MFNCWRLALAGTLLSASGLCGYAQAQTAGREICPRPVPNGVIAEPEDLRSEQGSLSVDLVFRNQLDEQGRMRYCYVDKNGNESPTLRLRPGDLLVLRLKNDLKVLGNLSKTAGVAMKHPGPPGGSSSACTNSQGGALATNLHFHGLTIAPDCHQDDVLRTSLQPTDAAYEFRFRVPQDQPPGLYWYHPHIHGLTREQVVGGASGALIVEGIESSNREVGGLRERILVIRDEDLLNPNAAPKGGTQPAPTAILDRDGDAKNTGDGSGKPAKDLTVNFVASAYPDYRGGVIRMQGSSDEFWRVVNASSITYLNLQLLVAGKPQSFGIVGVDGAPVNVTGGTYALWQNHLGVPPGGRTEFIVKGLPEGTQASLITRSVNTGPGGENDPTREIAKVEVKSDPAPSGSPLPVGSTVGPSGKLTWLGNVTSVRTRRLYFSEELQDPKDLNGPTAFYLTVEGQPRVLFDGTSMTPNIVVHEGDVEDWIVENRSQEVHDFHIHQVHFLMLEWFGIPINEPFLRDTVPVPFWDGATKQYPTVKLRMDFRSPNAVGLFPYHCHLLEHEDGGMMGLIQVLPRDVARPGSSGQEK